MSLKRLIEEQTGPRQSHEAIELTHAALRARRQ